MKKILSIFLGLICTFAIITPIFSANNRLEAVAGEDFSIGVGKKAIFDASRSIIPRGSTVEYLWDFGDGTQGKGKEVVHPYSTPGHYKVILTLRTKDLETSDSLTVDVYSNLIILVTSKSDESEINILKRQASKKGILLEIIRPRGVSPDFTTEESLAKSLLEKSRLVEQADLVITWTEGSVGFNVLSRFGQQTDLDLSHKTFVATSNKSFGSIEQLAKSAADILKPDDFVLTREDALDTLVTIEDTRALTSILQAKQLDYRVIGAAEAQKVMSFRYYNFLSYTVNAMKRNGVPANVLALILMLPIVATLIALARQLIGFKTFGIFIPSLIALSFLAIGLRYGIIIFALILLIGTIGRFLLRRLRLLYLPRMAILITVVSLAILGLWAVGVYFKVTEVISVSVFPILVMIILVEQFVSAQIEKGPRTAVILTVETLIISIIAYYTASWEYLRTFILNTPEWIFALIPINVLVGLYSGLRLWELWRFREVIRANRKTKK